MKKLTSLLILTLAVATAAFADIAPIKPKNDKKAAAIDTYLQIDLDREAKEAKLIIPRGQLKQLRAELDALDVDGGDRSAGGVTTMQTIVGGMFLSFAFVFAGLWFVKKDRMGVNGTRAAAAAAALVFAVGAFATIVYGNAGPPAEARSITGKMFTNAVHMYGFGSGKIKLEVSDDVRSPTLIVPDPQDTKKTDE